MPLAPHACAGLMVAQLTQTPPPVPQAASDVAPTQTLPEQQVPQLEGPHCCVWHEPPWHTRFVVVQS